MLARVRAVLVMACGLVLSAAVVGGAARPAETASVAEAAVRAQEGAAAPEPLRPPFRRVWRFDTGSQTESFVVAGEVAYYGTFSSYGALDLKTGLARWQKSIGTEHFGAEVAHDGKILYVAIGKFKIAACDPETGEELWSQPIAGSESAISVCDDIVVCIAQDGRLVGLDARTGGTRWRLDSLLGGGLSTPPQAAAGLLFVGTYAGEVVCLDAHTGALLWRRRGASSREGRVSGLLPDGKRLYCATERGLMALDLADGRLLWRFETTEAVVGRPALLGELVLIGAEDGKIHAVGRADGRLRWESVLSTAEQTDASSPTIQAGQVLVTAESKLSAYTEAGARLWEWDTEDRLFGYPVVPLGDDLLIADSRGFRRFARGEPPGLPADGAARQALAGELVGRLDTLSDDERRTLVRLGDEACAALLPVVSERLQRFETAASADGKRRSEGTWGAWRQYAKAVEALSMVATKGRTAEVLALVQTAKTTDGRRDLLRWLADAGDEQLTLPGFLRILGEEKPDFDWLYSPTSTALRVVSRSHDARAVEFLLARLADPNTDPYLRHEAYVRLAETGGRRGLEAVLAARDTSREIPSLRSFLGLEVFGPDAIPGKAVVQRPGSRVTKLLATHDGPGGVVWGLFSCPALGSSDDLWIARRGADGWSEPIFTGTTQEALGKADWYERLVGDPALAKDSDGDGFTDLVERGLGTDPRAADSDGDGLTDARDRNPRAAPRKLDETEQVLLAAFDGRFRFLGERGVPCTVELPKRVSPFEFTGWDWIVLPLKAGVASPLAGQFGKGVAIVSFAAPNYDLTGAAVRGRQRAPAILWNEAHTEAKLEVSVIYGGLDGTGYDLRLRKLDDHWVVVEATLIWVS